MELNYVQFYDRTGVVPVDRRHCQTTAHCDKGCWRISRLTCGSDGKLYNNGCQMHRKNCGKMVCWATTGRQKYSGTHIMLTSK